MWEVTAVKHKLMTAGVALPLSWLLAWSAMNAMITGLHLPVEHPGILNLVWLLCALVGCVLFFFKNGGLLALSGSIAAIYWLWNNLGISRPIRALITRLTSVYNSAYHWGVLEFSGVDWQTASLDLLLAAWGGFIALGAAAAIIRGRGGVAAVLMAFPPLLATMVVNDTTPDALPLFGLLLAAAVMLLIRSVAFQSPQQGAVLAMIAVLPLTLALGGLFLLYPKDTYVNRAEEQLDAALAWFQDNIVSPFQGGSNLGQTMNPTPTASASTRLGSLGPRRVTPYKVMEVTANFSGTLYLRGQDYDVYDGMSWTATADRVEVLEKSPIAFHRGTVTVRTLRPLDVVYIPSYPSRNYALNDGHLDNTGEETAFTWSVSQPSVLPDFHSSLGIDAAILKPYLQLPQSTTAWAEDYALQVLKKGGLSDWDLSAASNSQIARIIVDHVGNSARYSLNTSRMDNGYDDFARWFLEESDTGYCVHFATAATVLLRAAGVPARYVTGYAVNCEAGQTVTVESDRAHAWVEYFDASSNTWVIAEPTPPDLSEDEEETQTHTAPPPTTEPATEEDETTAPTRPTEPGATRPTDGEPADTSREGFTAWKLLRWFLLAAVLWFAVVFQRLLRIFLRRRRLAGGANRRALGLWQDVERLSAVLGQEPPAQLLTLAEKAKFSQHKLNKEELRQFTAWLKEARQELKQRPLPHRLWMQYILALW